MSKDEIHYYPVPGKPVDLDEVARLWPTVRQSILAKFDDCALSAYFDLAWSKGWNGNQAASGIMFHRVAAECLRSMVANDSDFIETGVALAILEDCLEQKNVAPSERLKIPLREVPNLRWITAKFAKDNQFTIRNVVDVEHRLTASLEYADEEGTVRKRDLTGQLDVLVAHPERDDEAINIDWKSGWGLPPARHEDSRDPGVSYHGYFQQRFYGWLVFKNYPSINAVTLREFYVRRGEVRAARIERTEVDRIEKDLAVLVMGLDNALASGRPTKLKFPDVAPWNPSPGKHCSFCLAPHRCPIERDVRESVGIATPNEARKAVAELEVAEAVRGQRREALRPYIEQHGPQTSKHSKGRRVLGLKTPKTGGKPSLRFFTPEGADRPPERQPEDQNLEDALRRSAEAAKAAEG